MTTESEVWAELCAFGRVRRFRPGERLLRGDAETEIGGVIGIVEGMCKVVNVTGDGREALVAVRARGQIIGEIGALTGAPRSSSVVALTVVEASMIDRRMFDRWLDDEDGAGRRLATLLAGRIAETTRAQVGSRQRVESRLADRVLYLSDHMDSGVGDEIDTPLTHDDYASWIGATRAVTTRAFGALRRQGLIDFGRGWLRIVDRPGLERLQLDR